MRILVTDGMDKSAMAQLRANGHEVVEQFYEPAELGAALRDFDAVVIRSATKIRKAQLEVAKDSQLKLIIRGGVGVDNIDVADAEAMGIAVRNTPNASSNAVAEHQKWQSTQQADPSCFAVTDPVRHNAAQHFAEAHADEQHDGLRHRFVPFRGDGIADIAADGDCCK